MAQPFAVNDPEAIQLQAVNSTNTLTGIRSNTESLRNAYRTGVSNLANIDKHITRLPQFHNTDDLLSCLSQISNVNTADLTNIDSDSLAIDSNRRFEVIVENQRGAMVFGIPLFSTESLLYPIDPSQYQTLKGSQVPRLDLYPLPGTNWKWSWPTWYALMINDVDEQGWIYSYVRFGSRRWKGTGSFGNFVRRRVWIRMRERDSICSTDNLFDNLPKELVVNNLENYVADHNLLIHPTVSSKEKKSLKRFSFLFHKKKKRQADKVSEVSVIDVPTITMTFDTASPSNIQADTDNGDKQAEIPGYASMENTLEPTTAHSSLTKTSFFEIEEKLDSVLVRATEIGNERKRVDFFIESFMGMTDNELDYLLSGTDVLKAANGGNGFLGSHDRIQRVVDLLPHLHKPFFLKLKTEITNAKADNERSEHTLSRLNELLSRFKVVVSSRLYHSESLEADCTGNDVD